MNNQQIDIYTLGKQSTHKHSPEIPKDWILLDHKADFAPCKSDGFIFFFIFLIIHNEVW